LVDASHVANAFAKRRTFDLRDGRGDEKGMRSITRGGAMPFLTLLSHVSSFQHGWLKKVVKKAFLPGT
jgi:hypothetical protein